MLTIEILNQNSVLKELSEDAKKAIAELSKNDEEQVIGAKVKEIYTNFDNDILKIVGSSKPGGVKTYDWNMQLLKDYKTKAEKAGEVETKLADLKKEKEKLEEQVRKGGGDQALKDQIAELEKKVNDESTLAKSLRDQLASEKSTYETELKKRDTEAHQGRVNSLWVEAQSGMKFKDEKVISKSVREAVIKAKIAELNSIYTVDFGKSPTDTPVFRDKDGNIVRNPDNNQNPYQPYELLGKDLGDILLENRKAGGAGGGGNPGGGGGSFVLNGARTQSEAQTQIREHLTKSLGLVAGTQEFADKQVELTRESGVKDLPLF